jgi:hypothetical protein
MAMIVDMPLCPVEVPEEKRCIHMMMSNERCPREAVMQERCDVHYHWHVTDAAAMGVQFPEDSISLQVMLMKAMDMVVTNRVDYKRAKSLVELCKLMAHNVRAYQCEVQDAEKAARKKLRAVASD